MAYSDFSLERVIDELGLEVSYDKIFHAVDPVEVPTWLRVVLDQYSETPLINEKSRREVVIFPILVASRELSGKSFSIYSGVTFEGDAQRGLVGVSDFLLSSARALPILMPPLLAVVHGKSGDVELGLGECIAQMVGAQLYNQRKGQTAESMIGCVTTGNDWLFLHLQQARVRIHPETFSRGNLPQLLGVMRWLGAQSARVPRKSGKYMLLETKNPLIGKVEAKDP